MKLFWVYLLSFRNKTALVSTILLWASIGCATLEPQYGIKTTKELTPPKANGSHTIFLIGDAGNADKSIGTQTLNHLSNRLKLASSNSTLLFLGDNIYQKGLPPEDDLLMHQLKTSLKCNLKLPMTLKEKQFSFQEITIGTTV